MFYVCLCFHLSSVYFPSGTNGGQTIDRTETEHSWNISNETYLEYRQKHGKYVHSIKVGEVCEKGNATHRVAALNLVLGDTLVTHCTMLLSIEIGDFKSWEK